MCIGNCGMNIGDHAFKQLLADHAIDRNGLKRQSKQDESLASFFEEPTHNTYTPRVIMIDMDDATINTMQNSSLWSQLKTQRPNFYTLKPDHTAKLNFASAIYNCGPDVCEPIWHRIDSMIEKADNFQGFKFIYGIGENLSRVLTFQEVLRSYGGYPQNNETFVICKKAEGWGNHFVAVSEWNPTEPINLLSRK